MLNKIRLNFYFVLSFLNGLCIPINTHFDDTVLKTTKKTFFVLGHKMRSVNAYMLIKHMERLRTFWFGRCFPCRIDVFSSCSETLLLAGFFSPPQIRVVAKFLRISFVYLFNYLSVSPISHTNKASK